MPKVITESIPTKVNEQPAQLLDTLAQLRKVNDSKALGEIEIYYPKCILF